MSAYMCDYIHLTALASYAVCNNLYKPRSADIKENINEVLEILYQQNAKTISYRNGYVPERHISSQDQESFDPFFFLESEGIVLASKATLAQIYQSANCYAYQACYDFDWENSQAYDIINKIKNKTVLLNDCKMFSESELEAANWGAPGPVNFDIKNG